MYTKKAGFVCFTAIAGLGALSACGTSTGGTSSSSAPTTAAFIGGDGIVDAEFFKEAGSNGNGAFGTIAAPNAATLPSAASFVSAYNSMFGTSGTDALGAYSANTYDAMNILLTAAQEAIIQNGGTLPAPTAFREAVRSNVSKIVWKGAIGTTSFDANGDTTNALLSLYKGTSGAWAYSTSITVQIPGQATPGATATTPAPGTGLASCSGTVSVASDLPTSGSDATDGVPAQDGVKLAVAQAMSSGMFGGCTLQYLPMNDASASAGKHDPALGAANITGLAGNASVVGVVGPFNSSVAVNELPIANHANLTMISPSNTNPGLTIVGSNPDIDTASLKPTGTTTYFRVCTTDIGQGKALADYAANTLHLHKAYVISDNETYGKGLAKIFSDDFTADGGTIAQSANLPGTTTDFRSQITQAQGLGVDLIFFGGTSSNGGAILRKQMVQAGFGTAS